MGVRGAGKLELRLIDSTFTKTYWVDLSGSSVSKESACSAGDPGSILGSESPGEGNGNPLQYTCLENPIDRGAWWAPQSMGSQRVRRNWATNSGRSMQQRMRWLASITDSMGMNLSKFWEILKDREAWHAAVHRVTKKWTRLSNWTTTTTLSGTYSVPILGQHIDEWGGIYHGLLFYLQSGKEDKL